jgi:hypothetical protein
VHDEGGVDSALGKYMKERLRRLCRPRRESEGDTNLIECYVSWKTTIMYLPIVTALIGSQRNGETGGGATTLYLASAHKKNENEVQRFYSTNTNTCLTRQSSSRPSEIRRSESLST